LENFEGEVDPRILEALERIPDHMDIDKDSDSDSDSDSESDLEMPSLEEGQRVDRYTLVKWLGTGQFSTVWHARPEDEEGPKKRGRRRKNEDVQDHDVAIKFYTVDPLYESIGDAEQRNLRLIPPHANIQRLLGTIETPRASILPLASYDLDTYISVNGTMKAKTAAFTLLQLSLGLKHLHDQGMAHGDLKPENILVYHNRARAPITIAISDFDSIQFFTEESLKAHGMRRARTVGTAEVTTVYNEASRVRERVVLVNDKEEAYNEEPCVTYGFRAPEFILDGVYGSAADIWSLGCVYFEVRTGDPIFSDDTPDGEDEGAEESETKSETNGGAAEDSESGSDSDSDYSADSTDSECDMEHLIQMGNIFGPFPSDLASRHDDILTPKGVFREITTHRTTMQKVLMDKGLGRKDATQSASLLRSMMDLDASKRYSAAAVEEHIRQSYRTYAKPDA
jgi:serine/threonine protein kinase